VATKNPNPVRVVDGVAYLGLNRGLEAQVDVADVEAVREHHWWAYRNRPARTWYAAASTKIVDEAGVSGRSTLLMHRLILSAPAGKEVDHWNHDGLDNRRENLRVVTHAKNMENRRGANANSSTGIRGVYEHKVRLADGSTGLYYNCRVMVGGRSTTRNFPHTPEGLAEAVACAEELRRAHHDGGVVVEQKPTRTGVRGVSVYRSRQGKLSYQARVKREGKTTNRFFPHTDEGLAEAGAWVEATRAVAVA